MEALRKLNKARDILLDYREKVSLKNKPFLISDLQSIDDDLFWVEMEIAYVCSNKSLFIDDLESFNDVCQHYLHKFSYVDEI